MRGEGIFPVLLVFVETRNRTDAWRWDGDTQTLLWRNGEAPDAQPPRGEECCEVQRRRFYLERGIDAIEVRMEPEGDGRLILPKR